jgi:hypothetical protein
MKIVMKKGILLFFFSIVIFTSSTFNEHGFSEGIGYQAESWIDLAEESLESAYLAMLDAEKAGGDISQLVLHLNQALEWLSEAKNAIAEGNHNRALLLAENVLENATNTENQAHILESSAKYNAEIGFRNQVITSIASICLIVGLGFLIWIYFKKLYVRKMMKLKPEVSSHESG